jgi:hypothetical protein
MVCLDNKAPSWELSRWGGSGLRFRPPDDEGFTLRVDRRQLLYRGRKRSHRFTILSDSSFEYDCILNREPDSNVIAFFLEGAEQFDFFRQPDFIKDSFLAGSYAVYKKETLIGEGTGKLCHIHRPKIIDARGRWVWGNLSIVGNRFLITIPERWLSEAKYPVIVDPTIGTTTIGSQYLWDMDPPEPWAPLALECAIAFNQFTVAEAIEGVCTAYFYAYSNEEPESGGYPIIYDDNGFQPVHRLTRDEQFLDLEVSKTKPAGWRNTTFMTKETIPADSKIWFGLYTEYFAYARFDYGAKFYSQWNDDCDTIPDTLRVYTNWKGNDDDYDTFKISWYFTYTSAQNYTRTLTQGVKLTDTRKLTGTYKRTAIQTVRGTTFLFRVLTFFRHFVEMLKTGDIAGTFRRILRTLTIGVGNSGRTGPAIDYKRNIASQVRVTTIASRFPIFLRSVLNTIKTVDYSVYSVIWLRCLPEQETALDKNRHIGGYIRGLYVATGSLAETKHTGEYYRKQTDTAHIEALPLRHLFIFIKLLITGFVRDFIIQRFLKSNEDIVLKSCVCREITLESSIH